MIHSNRETEDEAEEPLDPAAERVRRKLVRFMAINLSILFVALMAVVIALVYRATTAGPDEETARSETAAPLEMMEGDITLPAGARIIGQALSGNRLALHLRLENGGEAIFIHDIADGTIVGRFAIIEEPTP